MLCFAAFCLGFTMVNQVLMEKKWSQTILVVLGTDLTGTALLLVLAGANRGAQTTRDGTCQKLAFFGQLPETFFQSTAREMTQEQYDTRGKFETFHCGSNGSRMSP